MNPLIPRSRNLSETGPEALMAAFGKTVNLSISSPAVGYFFVGVRFDTSHGRHRWVSAP